MIKACHTTYFLYLIALHPLITIDETVYFTNSAICERQWQMVSTLTKIKSSYVIKLVFNYAFH